MATLTRSAARRAAASAAACLPGLLASASCGDLAVKGVFSFITKCPEEWGCVYACCASSCKKANSLSMYLSRSLVMKSTCLSSSSDCVSPHFQSLRAFDRRNPRQSEIILLYFFVPSCAAIIVSPPTCAAWIAPWRSPGYNGPWSCGTVPYPLPPSCSPTAGEQRFGPPVPAPPLAASGLAVDAAVSLPRSGPDGGPVHPVAQLDEKIAAQPLARLPLLAAVPFAICCFLGRAANTMLTKGYNNKTIDRKAPILAKLFTR